MRETLTHTDAEAAKGTRWLVIIEAYHFFGSKKKEGAAGFEKRRMYKYDQAFATAKRHTSWRLTRITIDLGKMRKQGGRRRIVLKKVNKLQL